jgi:hypothetical protein
MALRQRQPNIGSVRQTKASRAFWGGCDAGKQQRTYSSGNAPFGKPRRSKKIP